MLYIIISSDWVTSIVKNMAAIFDQEILFGRLVQQGSGYFVVHSERSTFECDLPSLEDYQHIVMNFVADQMKYAAKSIVNENVCPVEAVIAKGMRTGSGFIHECSSWGSREDASRFAISLCNNTVASDEKTEFLRSLNYMKRALVSNMMQVDSSRHDFAFVISARCTEPGSLSVSVILFVFERPPPTVLRYNAITIPIGNETTAPRLL